MDFTNDELIALNSYFNGAEDLPVEVEAINVRLREHFAQDNSAETPEVEAAVADDIAVVDDSSATTTDAPVEPEAA